MKNVFVLLFALSILSVTSYSQNNLSLSLNSSVVVPQLGPIGIGSNLSFGYDVTGHFSIHHGAGFLLWSNTWRNSNSHALLIFSISPRYYFTESNIRPYLSGELSYAIGKQKFTNGRYNFSDNTVSEYDDELKINEFLSGLGAGIIYPLNNKIGLELNYTLIMSAKTISLLHMRGAFGILYRI